MEQLRLIKIHTFVMYHRVIQVWRIDILYVGVVLLEPWIFSGTMRENILFGLEYDAQKFNRCIHATALNIV